MLLDLSTSAYAIGPERPLASLAIRALRIEDGLPQETVAAIAQTGDGHLWVGTQAGLARYDGRSIVVEPLPGAPGLQAVTALLTDGARTLWVVSARGLLRGRLEPDGHMSFVTIKAPQAPPNDHWVRGVQSWPPGSNGALVRTGTGACRVSPGQEVCEPIGGLPGDLSAMTVLADGGMIFGTDSSGLWRLDATGVAAPMSTPTLPERPVMAVLEAEDQSLWVAWRSGGITRISGQDVRHIGEAQGLPDDHVFALHQDRDGAIWAASLRGLARLGPDGAERFAPLHPLAGISTIALTEDREGSLWVGTVSNGLLQVFDRRIDAIDHNDGLPVRLFRAVVPDAHAGLWLGTAYGGVVHWTPGQTEGGSPSAITVSGSRGLSGRDVFGLSPHHAGGVWVAAGAGVDLVELDRDETPRVTALPAPPQHTRLQTTAVLEDSAGTLWIGTRSQGVWRFRPDDPDDPAAGGHFDAVAGGPREIVAIEACSDGSIWALGRDDQQGLLARLDPPGVERGFAMGDNGLSGLACTGPDQLYFTAGARLFRRKGSAITSVELPTGPAGVHGASVAATKTHLYVSSNRAILRVSLADLDKAMAGAGEAPPFMSFEQTTNGRAFIAAPEGHPGIVATADGRLWFAARELVAFIDPDRVRSNPVAPDPLITRVMADGEAMRPGHSVTLPAGTRRLDVAFTAAALLEPHKLRFRHRLEGFDPGWIDDGRQGATSYSSLPAGQFRLVVQARNNDGVWATRPALLTVIQKPRFRDTWVFWLMLAGALGLGTAAFHVARTRTISKRVQHEQQTLHAERTRMARELHDSLLQGLSGATMLIQDARFKLSDKSVDSDPESSSAKASNVHRQDDRLAALRQISLAEETLQGGLAQARALLWDLRSEGAPSDLVDNLSAVAGTLDAATGTPIKFEVTGAPRPLPGRAGVEIFRIGSEALSNAARHANAHTITCRLDFGPTVFTLTVQDDGKGFDATGPTRPGHQGLLAMKERCDSLGATFTIDTAPSCGTCIRVTLAMAI